MEILLGSKSQYGRVIVDNYIRDFLKYNIIILGKLNELGHTTCNYVYIMSIIFGWSTLNVVGKNIDHFRIWTFGYVFYAL